MDPETPDGAVQVISAKPNRKVYGPNKRSTVRTGVPPEFCDNPELLEAIRVLPDNYNFEIPKTLWRIRKSLSKCVALQFPEGLALYAFTIADILKHFSGVDVIILADVTYGACCIDDIAACDLGADMIVHYGHSCLIPVQTTKINVLYVFVDIKFDTLHATETIKQNFENNKAIALVSTIQFVSTLQIIAAELRACGYDIIVPQSKPLSPGEVLGCTSPRITNVDSLVFIGDGRFHLESAMISNPTLPSYRYNPYDKSLTQEYYDFKKMMKTRQISMQQASNSNLFGVILGTLGRQGNPKVLKNICRILQSYKRKYRIILLSEIFPEKLKLFSDVDAWVQIACPRLSIDWGTAFQKPLLTPFEVVAALKEFEWQNEYPMDFYASGSLGPWTPNHSHPKVKKSQEPTNCKTCSYCECNKDAE